MSDAPQTYPWTVFCKWAEPAEWHPIAKFAYQQDALKYAEHQRKTNATIWYDVAKSKEPT